MSALNEGIVIDFGVTGIIVAVYAVVLLVIAILALVALFSQKKLLAQINNTLMRQGQGAPAQSYAPPAPSYTPPAPNTCPKCGAVHAPGAAFCQNCGAAL